MIRSVRGPRRVRMPYVERLMETLSDRDWAVIESVVRLRLVSGLQLERLHFADLALRSRSVKRWQVLKRLTDARVLIPFERRVGTARQGSAKLSYALDSAGQQLARLRAYRSGGGRPRRPRAPGERFLGHALAVTELYVTLVELSRLRRFTFVDFEVELAWSDGLGGWLRPDALVKLSYSTTTDYWWYEADLATESPRTMRGKLANYLDFVERGQLGPDGIVPRVLVGVPTAQRRLVVQRIVHSLPSPAEVMFMVTLLPEAPIVLANELMSA
jgi:hypothetical protein